MRLVSIALILALSSPFTGLLAQIKPSDTLKNNPDLKVYNTTRLSTEKPVIDGKLDDACWQTGEWMGEFIQWIPNEGAKPSQPTHFKILYDNKNIYVAIRAFDNEPGKISKKAGRRDEMTGDIVGINFDSYHDHRTGFEFSVTAAGQKIDLLLTNPMDGDMNWNAVWYVKTGMEDSAWVAEYEIPLSQLRYSKAQEQVWGMHLWRWIDRLSEERDWGKQSLTGPGMLYSFGELRGISNLPKSRRIEIMPYAVGKLKTFTKEPLNPFRSSGYDWLGNVGLDAKIGLSSNLTADLTVNPDFGQVEADPSEMNLSAFETFYEEKRPFFLEGKNIFQFDLGEDNLFYSRRIGQAPGTGVPYPAFYTDYPDNTSILSAVKISGKTSKGLAVGILHSLTSKEKGNLFYDGQTRKMTIEPLTNYLLARVQQDYKEGNTVLGGIITSTNRFAKNENIYFKDRQALTGGIDLLHQWHDKEFFLDAKFISSIITGSPYAIQQLQINSAHYYQRPDAKGIIFDPRREILGGGGAHVKIGKGSKGLLRYSSEFNWKSPGLDLNDMGFMQMADIAEQETEVSYFVNKPVSIFRTYTLALHQSNEFDSRMNYHHSNFYLTGSMDFMNRWQVAADGSYRTESLDTRLMRGGEAVKLPAGFEGSFHLNSDMSKKVIFRTTVNFTGTDYNHYTGSSYRASLSVIPYNVLKVSLSMNYTKEKDNFQYLTSVIYIDPNTDEPGASRQLFARIDQQSLNATFRVDFNITPELSLQYYGSPYVFTGKYSKFKEITNGHADYYYDRFSLLTTTPKDDQYEIKMDKREGIDPVDRTITINNPNFIFTQFRSNLVFRWEYRPGSQLFLVWGNERTNPDRQAAPRIKDIASELKKARFDNIFLVKLNYWFSL